MKLTRSRTLQTIVLVMVVIGLIALALGGYLTPVSRYLLSPVIVAQTWLSTRFTAIQNYLSSPQDITRLRDRNTALEAEVSRLQTEIINLKQQIDETRVLSALVDFARVNPEYRYVAASVIGHQRQKGWLITDAGWMALSQDRGTSRQKTDQGYGVVCDIEGRPYPDLIVVDAYQEHGIIARRPGLGKEVEWQKFPIGSMVRILPNHACATGAMHDRYYVVDGTAEVISVWPRINGY